MCFGVDVVWELVRGNACIVASVQRQVDTLALAADWNCVFFLRLVSSECISWRPVFCQLFGVAVACITRDFRAISIALQPDARPAVQRIVDEALVAELDQIDGFIFQCPSEDFERVFLVDGIDAEYWRRASRAEEEVVGGEVTEGFELRDVNLRWMGRPDERIVIEGSQSMAACVAVADVGFEWELRLGDLCLKFIGLAQAVRCDCDRRFRAMRYDARDWIEDL